MLEIAGLVRQPRTYTFDDLTNVSGQIADVSQLAPDREGAAVTLAALLELAQPTPDARFITLEAEGGYAASIPIDAVIDQAIVMYRLGAAPLPEAKGGPLRFLIPDVAACRTADVDACANVKYLRRIELSAEPGRDVRPQTIAAHGRLHEAEWREGRG
jgi:DMSO/TMAO reductase YedYZ molybdopterin-dependent catalytic subunit